MVFCYLHFSYKTFRLYVFVFLVRLDFFHFAFVEFSIFSFKLSFQVGQFSSINSILLKPIYSFDRNFIVNIIFIDMHDLVTAAYFIFSHGSCVTSCSRLSSPWTYSSAEAQCQRRSLLWWGKPPIHIFLASAAGPCYTFLCQPFGCRGFDIFQVLCFLSGLSLVTPNQTGGLKS